MTAIVIQRYSKSEIKNSESSVRHRKWTITVKHQEDEPKTQQSFPEIKHLQKEVDAQSLESSLQQPNQTVCVCVRKKWDEMTADDRQEEKWGLLTKKKVSLKTHGSVHLTLRGGDTGNTTCQSFHTGK